MPNELLRRECGDILNRLSAIKCHEDDARVLREYQEHLLHLLTCERANHAEAMRNSEEARAKHILRACAMDDFIEACTCGAKHMLQEKAGTSE